MLWILGSAIARRFPIDIVSVHPVIKFVPEPVVLVHHKGPLPVKIDKVSLSVGHSVLQSQPVFALVLIFLIRKIKGVHVAVPGRPVWIVGGLAKNPLLFPVGVQDERSHGSDRVDESVPVFDGLHTSRDPIEFARIVNILLSIRCR